MTPRNFKELSRLSEADCRALLAELCGITQALDQDCRHDWLTLDGAPVLIESTFTEDYPGAVSGWVAEGAFINGRWVEVEDCFPNHGTEWSIQVNQMAREEAREAA